MPRRAYVTTIALVFLMQVAGAWGAEKVPAEVIFREDFRDIAMPAWHGAKPRTARCTSTRGPNGVPALTLEASRPVSCSFSVRLPAQRIAGKAVLLDVWRKADKVKTGTQHYFNAKSMLSWKSSGQAKPNYSGTIYSDFSGTFDWERHRYVVQMPQDLQWASVTVGLQGCTGKASWADLRVSVDPRFPSQQALERFLAQEERQAYANLDSKRLSVKRLNGGTIQVFTGQRYVPRQFWNEAVRQAVLSAVSAQEMPASRLPDHFRARLAHALQTRAKQLQAGLGALKGNALNDRVYEIASLRERVRQLLAPAVEERHVELAADTTAKTPVSLLVFGNNINAQNLIAPYDSARGQFQEEFLKRVRPMGITFLRYPGGCNADIFNWKDTIGPLDQRREILNYHNGLGRGIPRFGVDEYLRFCEQEGMTPIITTAFCKDRPEKVDPNEHPNGIRHRYVFSYLKTAPERVQLAADWVEYCNGSVETQWGKLRAQNGHPKPYNVKYWEVGNESYGPDPTGSCQAEEYAKAFPAYVQAMKARDPSIAVVMNGCSRHDWNEPLLRLAGEHADAFQFHIYRTPRINDYRRREGQPHQATEGMRLADDIPGLICEIETLMTERLGRALPMIISEFGMGNARNREYMTSISSAVLVADMWRALVESPAVLGANKWCLFTGYWFSQIQGPTLAQPDAPYYNRPEHAMHVLYARCRSDTRLVVNNEVSQGAKAVVFKRADSYGVVLIGREAVSWQSVVIDLPGAKAGEATCLLVTAGHPFLGNENDHELISPYEFEFDYTPGKPIVLPSSSVMGLIVPR